MLLSTSGAQAGPVTYALDRVLEIGLGCIIGFAVSLLVLPGRAHRLLAEASAEAVRDFREMVDLLLRDLAAPADREALLAIHICIRKAIARVEAFVDEAKHERANRLSDAPDPEPVARNLRRLRHDLTTIGWAVAEPLPTPGRQHLAEAVGHLRGSIADFLTAAADALERRRPPPPIGPIDAALTAFNDAIGDHRRSDTMAQQSADVVARTYSLAFALFQLREDLGDLADRILELADAKMRAAKTPPA